MAKLLDLLRTLIVLILLPLIVLMYVFSALCYGLCAKNYDSDAFGAWLHEQNDMIKCWMNTGRFHSQEKQGQ